MPGTPVPAALETQIGQWGRPNITPGKKHPKQDLLPRPVRPQQISVEDAGEGFRNVQVPAGYGRPERGYNQVQKQMDLRKAKNRQRRDIGIVSGGVLASILGLDALTRKDEEQEAV